MHSERTVYRLASQTVGLSTADSPYERQLLGDIQAQFSGKVMFGLRLHEPTGKVRFRDIFPSSREALESIFTRELNRFPRGERALLCAQVRESSCNPFNTEQLMIIKLPDQAYFSVTVEPIEAIMARVIRLIAEFRQQAKLTHRTTRTSALQ